MFWWKFSKFLTLFSKPQVSFSSNFASLSNVMKDNSSLLSYINRYILFTEETNQCITFWDFWVLRSKFTKFLSVLKQQSTFSSNFASIFSVMRHNSSLLSKLKFYMLSTKGTYQGTNLVKPKVWHLALWWVTFVKIIQSFN